MVIKAEADERSRAAHALMPMIRAARKCEEIKNAANEKATALILAATKEALAVVNAAAEEAEQIGMAAVSEHRKQIE